jgi:putative tryptophan/tyrosine transport system substrate-binding protein
LLLGHDRVRDRVGTGIVASLARPGGNITGLSIQATDLAGKRLELLREMVPGLHRLAVLADTDNPFVKLDVSQLRQAGAGLGVEVATFEMRRGEDMQTGWFKEVRVKDLDSHCRRGVL